MFREFDYDTQPIVEIVNEIMAENTRLTNILNYKTQ